MKPSSSELNQDEKTQQNCQGSLAPLPTLSLVSQLTLTAPNPHRPGPTWSCGFRGAGLGAPGPPQREAIGPVGETRGAQQGFQRSPGVGFQHLIHRGSSGGASSNLVISQALSSPLESTAALKR